MRVNDDLKKKKDAKNESYAIQLTLAYGGVSDLRFEGISTKKRNGNCVSVRKLKMVPSALFIFFVGAKGNAYLMSRYECNAPVDNAKLHLSCERSKLYPLRCALTQEIGSRRRYEDRRWPGARQYKFREACGNFRSRLMGYFDPI